MDIGILVIAILVLMSLTSGSGAAAPPGPAVPGSIEDLARQESDYHDFPLWYMLATGWVESRLRQLPPTGSGAAKTFYPYGMTIERARDMNPGASNAEIESIIQDLQAQSSVVAEHLAIGWGRYAGDDEALRIHWVAPGTAKRGRPWPAKIGSVATATRLKNWSDALDRFKPADVG